MAGILIRGCTILAKPGADGEFARGDVRIDGDRLTHVGEAPAALAEDTEVIDGRGKIALPGFVSTHHHLFQSLLRGLSGDAALPEWLRSCILPTAPHFRPEDLYWGVRLSLAECIESGVTTIADWAFNLHGVEHAEATYEAMAESGARIHFAYGPSMAKGWGDFDLRLEDFESVRARFFGASQTPDRVTLWAGLGGPELQREERFREEMGIARSYGLRVHIHLRENEAFEPKDAVERLDRWGLLGPDLLLAHAIHLRDVDLDLVARTHTKVSYNALSNMRLGDGICRVVELRRRGVDVGLGLDGSASNDNNDFFALLRSSVGLQRARWLRADCLSVNDVLEMATVAGARCVGQEAEIGSLQPGKRADVILIDPRTLNVMPVNDLPAQLVFCAQPRNVDTVIVGGRVLKRNAELVDIDLQHLLAKCQEAATRVTGRAGMSRKELPA